MNKLNSELPAFASVSESYQQDGLTKREYFAGLALQGLLANANGATTEGGSKTFSPDWVSELALRHADALLFQLEKI